MPGNITLRSPGWTQLMSTELNSLAAASSVGQSTGTNPAYDNSGTASSCFWADFELRVTFGTAPTAGQTVDLYLIPLSSDGTSFVDGTTGILPPTLLVGSWVVRAVTTAQIILLRNIPLPNDKFVLVVVNNTSQAFPGSGNTVKCKPAGEYYN